MYKYVNFLNLKLSALTKKEIIDALLELCKKGRPAKKAIYINAHCVNISFSDKEYRAILNTAELVYAGGQGVVWAAGFLGCPVPERVNILDFFEEFIERLIDKKITVYLLGSTREVVEKTGAILKNKGVDIVGARDGFFPESECAEVIKEINKVKPDLLIVGMGAPKQEKWIKANSHKLDAGLCWAVGAAFEWISGYRKRAPMWMIRLGFEWLHRLLQQPVRLWKRYVFGNIIFIYHVLSWRIKHGKDI